MPLTRNHGYLQGVHGLRLHFRTWEPARPRAGLVLVHGLAEHAARYEEFGSTMAVARIGCFAADLRGHGMSEGRRGHVRSFDVFLQDLDRVRREVQSLLPPGCPLFLLGHSMGGLIALRYLEEFENTFSGGIAISPWLATAMPVPRWKVMLANALNRVLPAAPFRARIDSSQLSRDAAICQAYRDDPLVHDTITPRLFTEASIAMGLALQRAERIRVPLLLMLAGEDRLVDTQRTIAFAKSMPAGRVTTRVFPEAYHELLNELDRHRVQMEIRDWIIGA